MKIETIKDKKKVIILIIIAFVVTLGIIFGVSTITKKDTNKENDNEIKEIKFDNNEQEEVKTEDETNEEQNNNEEQIGSEELKEELEGPNTDNDKQENQNTGSTNNNSTQKEENSSNTSKPSNNNTSNNNINNNSSNNSSSNNSNTNTNENTSDNTDNETSNEPTIVTSNNINLNDYNSDIMITKDGTYTLSGTLKYTVYIKGESKVTLNLNGVTIKSKTDSAIANIDTNDLVINLNEGTTNTLSDGIVESTYDGCVFSYGEITINGNGNLAIYGNQIDGEGIATKNSPITINGGNIKVYTVDDGLNTGGIGGTISVNGGNLFVQAGGDAIDSNKDIVINDGVVSLIGGSSGVNSSLDADSGYQINGGTIVALGTEQLALPTSAAQNTLLLSLNEPISSKTIVTLLDSEDNVITSFKANDKFKTIIISSDKLVEGSYYLYKEGSNTGTLSNGIYTGGTYTKGELISIDNITEFVIKDKITNYIGS